MNPPSIWSPSLCPDPRYARDRTHPTSYSPNDRSTMARTTQSGNLITTSPGTKKHPRPKGPRGLRIRTASHGCGSLHDPPYPRIISRLTDVNAT